MKKKLLLLVLCFYVFVSSAQEIKPINAKNIALNYYKHFNKSETKLDLKLIYTAKIKNNSTLKKSQNKDIPLFYVFNTNSNGFILVAATNSVVPILGYSNKGNFNYSDLPPNLKEFLESYKQQIEYAIRNKIEATADIQQQWTRLKSGKKLHSRKKLNNQVKPLVTAKWGQLSGWNRYCPKDEEKGVRCPVGCVAVAIGQIMSKWKFPVHGKDSNSYTHPKYGKLYADFEHTTYKWDEMSDITPNKHSALLLYHCGIAVDMSYSPNVSTASFYTVKNALVKYFNYSPRANSISKAAYTSSEWKRILKKELDNGRPIYYRGQGSYGHAFVCDGYDRNLFHFNWGWSGRYNGYYTLDNLIPEKNSNFNQFQMAIINIYPNNADSNRLLYASHEIDDNNRGNSKGNNNGKAEPSETIELAIELYNVSNSTIHDIKGVLSTKDKNIKITDNNISWKNMEAGRYVRSSDRFTFEVAESCPEKDITFTLKITSKEGTWSEDFTVRIYCITPPQPNEIFGKTIICSQEEETYSIPKVEGAITYQWSYSGEGTLIENGISCTLSAQSSGILSVVAKSNCDKSIPQTKNIEVLYSPIQPKEISGKTNICPKVTESFSIPEVAGATAYQWSYSGKGIVTENGTSCTLSAQSSGVLSVVAENSCGTSSSQNHTIDVIEVPQPSIYRDNDILYSSISKGNQWYNNDKAINGAVYQDFTITESGNYYVIVTKQGCTSAASNSIEINLPQDGENKTIKIYPNPVHNKLTIKAAYNTEMINYEIINLTGQVVFRGNLTNRTTLDISNFKSGIYFFRLGNGENKRIIKIIKK